ncbi:MAG: ABC transporter ATP-binding protein [Oscillospiraceae bacterium]|nr:ABC transporter ATP-binding protein [Oscillospiraceae bacterium]MBR4093552.1 ABC transporter ATP-binding protein [Oscillospiraceae bacterium]
MIEIKGVTKKFDNKFTALDNIDLTIPTGTAFGLLGSNGAGKSTILRLISGIYKQEEGTVKADGEDIFDNVSVKERVFFIDDETVQFSKYTLKSLKDFYKGYYPNFSEELFEKLRAQVNLPMDKRIDRFSKGMKRQAIVIVGLACKTDYLLLDEAFDGLDPTMRIIVKNMLVDAMLDRNLTAIISSHNLKEINEVCDTVALLHKGKILFNRDLDSVKGNIHKVQAAFAVDYNGKEDFEGLNVLHYERTGSVCYLIIKGSEEEIRENLKVKKPLVLDIVPLSLEEIFIYEMEGLGYDSSEVNG